MNADSPPGHSTTQRVFQENTNYSLPTDAEEHARLRLQHNALKIFLGGNNYIIPTHDEVNFQHVLDLCSGSGQWVIDVAESFPSAEVHGVDLALPQIPENSVVPPNAQFHIVDINQPLPFSDRYFDIVQMRIVPSIPERLSLLKEISRILRPGGYVTFLEPGPSFSGTKRTRTTALIEVDHLMMQSPHTPSPDTADILDDRIWSLAPKIMHMLQEAVDDRGNALFCDVSSSEFLVPIGGWPDEEKLQSVGAMMAEVLMGLIDAFRPTFIGLQLLTADEFSSLRARVLTEIEDPDLKLQIPFTSAWGRKVAD